MKIDPIIAVKNVQASADWYCSVFKFKSLHGGDEFDILASETNEIMLCLHKWGEHDHPTMMSNQPNAGNGLILYFRTDQIDQIRKVLHNISYSVETEIELSPNSRRREFSLRDPDGYYITIAEYHEYEG